MEWREGGALNTELRPRTTSVALPSVHSQEPFTSHGGLRCHPRGSSQAPSQGRSGRQPEHLWGHAPSLPFSVSLFPPSLGHSCQPLTLDAPHGCPPPPPAGFSALRCPAPSGWGPWLVPSSGTSGKSPIPHPGTQGLSVRMLSVPAMFQDILNLLLAPPT